MVAGADGHGDGHKGRKRSLVWGILLLGAAVTTVAALALNVGVAIFLGGITAVVAASVAGGGGGIHGRRMGAHVKWSRKHGGGFKGELPDTDGGGDDGGGDR